MLIARKRTHIAVCFLTLAMMMGCARRHDADEYYVLVASNKSIPYWQTVAKGFFEAGKQANVRTELVGPDNYDINQEKAEFQSAMTKKPTGILVSPADAALLQPEINQAVAAGIPVLTIDTDAPQSNRLFFIGTNNYQAGQLGGEVMAKALNGKGNVVVYTMPNQENLEERMNGYKRVFERYPGIKIQQVIDIKGDARIAFDQTQALLDKKVPVDGFICLEALAGKEVATVLDNNHVTGKTVVAMDTDDRTLDYVKKGLIAATIAQKPYTMGYVGFKMVDDYYHNKANIATMGSSKDPFSPIPAFVDTGATLVDKSNVNEIADAIQGAQTKKEAMK